MTRLNEWRAIIQAVERGKTMDEIEKKKAEEEFERFVRSWPESKLELLDGKLVAGNCLEGSRLLFQQILRGWKAEAVVALGSLDQWIEALWAAYEIAPAEGDVIESLEAQAAAIEFEEEDLSLSPGSEGPYTGHHWVRSDINLALHGVSSLLGGGALGRDFVMRLGENGFTPDALFYKSQELNTLYEYYLGGPAEMVIEVTSPAHERYDREVKRELYARGGVPEYIIIGPDREKRRVEFWRLINGDYRLQMLDADGRYRPQSVPGLAIAPDDLWSEGELNRYASDKQPFIVEKTAGASPRWRGIDNGMGWGALAFAPRLDLLPTPIRFDEYISWCPESKFEFADGRPDICGRRGIRNLTGMLTMTFGMVETCRLAAPKDWVAALKRRRDAEARDQQAKDAWRQKARAIAAMLRDKHGLKRVGVTGDLLRANPLGFWSELTMVVWEAPTRHDFEIYKDVSTYEDEIAPEINYLESDSWHFEEDADFADVEIIEI